MMALGVITVSLGAALAAISITAAVTSGSAGWPLLLLPALALVKLGPMAYNAGLGPRSGISGHRPARGRKVPVQDFARHDRAWDKMARSLGLQAYACFPVHVGNMTIGTLTFGTRERTRFEDGELTLIGMVADPISVSIKRKRAEVALKDR